MDNTLIRFQAPELDRNCLLSSSEEGHNIMDQYCSFPVKKLRIRKVKSLAQGHTANEWLNESSSFTSTYHPPAQLAWNLRHPARVGTYQVEHNILCKTSKKDASV